MNGVELFSPQSLLTITSAVTIVVITCNTFQWAFNWKPKWFVLLVSLIVSFLGVCISGETTVITLIMGLFNGFLICMTSLGGNMVVNRTIPNNSANSRNNDNDNIDIEEIKDPFDTITKREKANRTFFQNWLY